jgi:hypothetical protein
MGELFRTSIILVAAKDASIRSSSAARIRELGTTALKDWRLDTVGMQIGLN